MPNLNKVMLMGNLTRDPELRFLPNNNMPVCNLGLAVNRTWTDRQTSEKRQETTFVDLEAFARTAEVINQYFRKGSPIFIEGRLKLDQWQDREGNNRSKLKVIVESFEFIDSRRDSNGGGGGNSGGGYQSGGSGGYSNQRSNNQASPSSAPQQASGPQHEPLGDDDIPF